jgi:hypothetical protein
MDAASIGGGDAEMSALRAAWVSAEHALHDAEQALRDAHAARNDAAAAYARALARRGYRMADA